ncbi:hypothetical protein M758_UG229200 [Ceratodon purpureus]|nr:hypothetical protein M758_UG229200 [Ceratodon purpureus]
MNVTIESRNKHCTAQKLPQHGLCMHKLKNTTHQVNDFSPIPSLQILIFLKICITLLFLSLCFATAHCHTQNRSLSYRDRHEVATRQTHYSSTTLPQIGDPQICLYQGFEIEAASCTRSLHLLQSHQAIHQGYRNQKLTH